MSFEREGCWCTLCLSNHAVEVSSKVYIARLRTLSLLISDLKSATPIVMRQFFLIAQHSR
ncbi:hypothetical protein H1P_190028 [Hyella patelloides LEGE 07179]|uniref:Uncharacterized protein n=1 Tax=Hyella patelloides LEGE 07179 TaxID=945734 RepID=A0A563VPC6_9CYAN|nr:hypothetical protein H1P_190028 [Hyella patelloides LEGE 07179]